MLHFPQVQARAQEEVDNILGQDSTRLPDFGDRERLPYISALVEELLRWVASKQCDLDVNADSGLMKMVACSSTWRSALYNSVRPIQRVLHTRESSCHSKRLVSSLRPLAPCYLRYGQGNAA